MDDVFSFWFITRCTVAELSYVSDAVIYFQKETKKQKVYPPESPANSITIVLFCLFLMLLVYGKKREQEASTLPPPADAASFSTSL